MRPDDIVGMFESLLTRDGWYIVADTTTLLTTAPRGP